MQRVDYESLIIQDLLDEYKRSVLDISPWYQRRSVWLPAQQAYLTNSLFEKMPIPSIYIRHYLDIEKEKSIKEVVDGQQRIRAILDYTSAKFAAKHPGHKKRVKYGELSSAERKDFLLTKLSVGYLIDANDSDVIEMFGRLNSVSKNLNAQEKRNARYSGEFKQFCLTQAAQRVAFWREMGIYSAVDISRMLEVEAVSEIVLNLIKGLSDHKPGDLDAIYEEYDESFPKQDEIVERIDKVFNKLAAVDPKLIKETIFRRQPIFFSLFLALDKITDVKLGVLEDALTTIDSIFNDEDQVSEPKPEVAQFIEACTSSTQRIRARKIREEYIISFLKSK